MKEVKLDKNKNISMCSNSKIVNTNFNNCSTRDTVLSQKIKNETERAINKETELEEKIKESGKIDDVLVNGGSVVEDKIAKIDLTSYATKADVEEEKTERQEADTSIRTEIKQEILDKEIVLSGYYDEATSTFFKEAAKINPLPKENNKLYKDINTKFIYTIENNIYKKLLSIATEAENGLVKLYKLSGINEDGTMTQKAITNCINNLVSVNEKTEDLVIKTDF